MTGPVFAVGDAVRLRSTESARYLLRYMGRTGKVVHAEVVTSPYSGERSQAIHVRFAEGERHISENSSAFEVHG